MDDDGEGGGAVCSFVGELAIDNIAAFVADLDSRGTILLVL